MEERVFTEYGLVGFAARFGGERFLGGSNPPTPTIIKKEGNNMKYFLDTEFIESPGAIKLISIGLKCEDGREYYSISKEYDGETANDWVKENVLEPMYIEFKDEAKDYNILNFNTYIGKSEALIAREILDFIGVDIPEFWGYYVQYDWVVFCWLFGTMMDLPKTFPMYCNDIKQLMVSTSTDELPQPEGVHNALVDAKWNEQQYLACRS